VIIQCGLEGHRRVVHDIWFDPSRRGGRRVRERTRHARR
jgi:hypothetical protein